jgi:hypothetical protein
MDDTDFREMPCSKCGGDGGFSVPIGIDHRDGSLRERIQACEACEGTGMIVVELEPVSLEDIEEERR